MKKSLMEALKEVPDPRKGNAIRHLLDEIIMIGLLCIICQGETFVDMQLFGETHKEMLSAFLQLPNGIPSHDTFADVFIKLDPRALSECFNLWVQHLREEIERCGISIDGKTIRRSKGEGKKAVHVVTAFAGELQLTLGQLATDEKSNEITAIPKLLEMFTVKGNIITIDAMGTQTDIAQKIIEKDGDYVLSLKNNHPTLYEDVSLYLETEVMPQSKKLLEEKGLYFKTLEQGHGRIETRECFICPDIAWLDAKDDWAGLSGVGVISSKREETGKEATIAKHYFLYSLSGVSAKQLLALNRGHWAIENQLHWMLDVTFREDDSRARTENAAVNLNILRKQALQLMKRESSVKGSMRVKRLRCAYDLSYALKVIGVNTGS